jgi:hypothetical protein
MVAAVREETRGCPGGCRHSFVGAGPVLTRFERPLSRVFVCERSGNPCWTSGTKWQTHWEILMLLEDVVPPWGIEGGELSLNREMRV